MDTANTTPPGGHPAVYDALMWPIELAALGALRRRLAERARGCVLEVGAGTGRQLRWYPGDVQVTALEPDPGRAARARRAALRAVAPVSIVEAVAEHLPFPAASFDTVVTVLTLCTVADPQTALSEFRRVLVPGGRLLVLEHVHLRWQPGRSLQRWAAPVWAAAAGGCRLDRDTDRFVREAGFRVLRRRSHALGWILELEARSPLGLRHAPISG
jgi:ubiquinone/menaquinone biosynthesis C-methylase UbiE